MAEQTRDVSMEKITSLAKRRGFVFQSSEIYGGQSGACGLSLLCAMANQPVPDRGSCAEMAHILPAPACNVASDMPVRNHSLTFCPKSGGQG